MPFQRGTSFRSTSREQCFAMKEYSSSIVVRSENCIKLTSVQINTQRKTENERNNSHNTKKLGRYISVSVGIF